jgi:hypothetical protein
MTKLQIREVWAAQAMMELSIAQAVCKAADRQRFVALLALQPRCLRWSHLCAKLNLSVV